MSKYEGQTKGPWVVATSNSFRRIVASGGPGVCEPVKQRDGHPDLYFPNGGFEGPDAQLLADAPVLLKQRDQLLEALEAAMRFIQESPCDPDIYSDQLEAYEKLQNLEPWTVIAKARGEQ